MGKRIDYTNFEWQSHGNRFKVVDVADSVRKLGGQIRKMWKVVHLDCGTEFLCQTEQIKKQLNLVCPNCKIPDVCVGDVFGYWTVVGEFIIKHVGTKNKTAKYWPCKCKCNAERLVSDVALKNGRSQSCGCLNKEILSSHAIKLSGVTFGRLRAIERVGKCGSNGVPWKCYCDPELGGCGDYLVVEAGCLTSGNTKSCGCLRQDYDNDRVPKDITGYVSGYLVAFCLDRGRVKDTQRSYWVCYCDPTLGGCGNFTSVRADSLLNESIMSCGCYHQVALRERALLSTDLNLQMFTRWKVLEGPKFIELGKVGFQKHWLCECVCGKSEPRWVLEHSLLSGMSNSCGCLRSEHAKSLVGKNNPNWKNGITPLTEKIRRMDEYLYWRRIVLERDKYTCQFSNAKSRHLHIHHIKPFAQILEENNITTLDEARQCEELWDIDNGVTLARKWHLQGSEYESNSFHNVFGTKEFTQEDFRDWYMQL